MFYRQKRKTEMRPLVQGKKDAGRREGKKGRKEDREKRRREGSVGSGSISGSNEQEEREKKEIGHRYFSIHFYLRQEIGSHDLGRAGQIDGIW